MDTRYLRKRHQAWYVRVRVPKSLEPTVGTTHIVRSLRTTDLGVARQLRWQVVSDIKAYLGNLAAQASLGQASPESARFLVDAAASLQRKIRIGALTSTEALEDWELVVDHHSTFVKQDPETGEYALNKETEDALALGKELILHPDTAMLSDAVKDYVTETAPRIRKQTLAEKQRRLLAFQTWLRGDVPVNKITKSVAGRYVTEVLMKATTARGHHASYGEGADTSGANEKRLSPKTIKDTISDLSSFFLWCEDRGLLKETNPFKGQSRTIRETTRGTRKKEKRRPWTPLS